MAAAKKLRIRTKKLDSIPRTPRFDDFERLESGILTGEVSLSDLELGNEERALVEEGMNRHGFRHHFYAKNS